MGVVGLACLSALLFVFLRRRKQKKEDENLIAMEPRKKDRYKITDIEIQEKLGAGNFGEVYKGLWKVTKFPTLGIIFPKGVTPVALKKLKDEKQMEEFQKEAEILKLRKK